MVCGAGTSWKRQEKHVIHNGQRFFMQLARWPSGYGVRSAVLGVTQDSIISVLLSIQLRSILIGSSCMGSVGAKTFTNPILVIIFFGFLLFCTFFKRATLWDSFSYQSECPEALVNMFFVFASPFCPCTTNLALSDSYFYLFFTLSIFLAFFHSTIVIIKRVTFCTFMTLHALTTTSKLRRHATPAVLVQALVARRCPCSKHHELYNYSLAIARSIHVFYIRLQKRRGSHCVSDESTWQLLFEFGADALQCHPPPPPGQATPQSPHDPEQDSGTLTTGTLELESSPPWSIRPSTSMDSWQSGCCLAPADEADASEKCQDDFLIWLHLEKTQDLCKDACLDIHAV
ncbi:uncharacterized protein MYCFIDRAFT_169460 [Pseudocercospora fijiensis CIRAD86]|uniref:Uncharacterized protein n=1 Tax=Pseudocercospora fijiensis (strain CIRAD86) TaxID=383855 RepID=N1Q650_PSEFD|nr:uncharacterized protein MYCFIDRAFT_169460 [Pseudocercospora fijiensis CIRAD86]EME87685.1 hypothetical protein MYCFIDRAFT_169460 [Pseudocercospora fijiensis CIRAD86]